MASRAMAKYPTSVKLYQPAGRPYAGRRSVQEPRRRPAAPQADRGRERRGRRGPARPADAARDRFYKGDIARTMAAFSEQQGALFRYEDFAGYTAKVETPVSTNYRGYEVYKNPSANQGPAELFALNMLEGFDLPKMGLNSADYIHTSAEAVEARDGRPRKVSRRHRLHHDSVRGAAEQGVRGGAAQADRPGTRLARAPARESVQVHDPRGRPSSTIRTTSRSRATPRTTATPATWRSSTRIATW